MNTLILTAIGVAISAGVQAVMFFRWLHRRMRDDEIVHAFVRDIAENHLPHIYDSLQNLESHLGIDSVRPPMVQFVDFSERERRKKKTWEQ